MFELIVREDLCVDYSHEPGCRFFVLYPHSRQAQQDMQHNVLEEKNLKSAFDDLGRKLDIESTS